MRKSIKVCNLMFNCLFQSIIIYNKRLFFIAMTIVQKVSKQTKMKNVESCSSTIRSKIAQKKSRQVTQKQSRKTISKIKIRKTLIERKKTSKYKTKLKNEKTTIDDMFFL